jgi:hypothetical protein
MSLVGFKAYRKWSIDSFRVFLETNGFEITAFEVIPDKIPLVFAVAKKSGCHSKQGNTQRFGCGAAGNDPGFNA